MKILLTIGSTLGAIALLSPLAIAEPISFQPIRFSQGVTADLGGGTPVHAQPNTLSFCLRFGDDISANAIHSEGTALEGSSGSQSTVSPEAALGVLWSWLLGPVTAPDENAQFVWGTIWMIDGLLDSETLAAEFASVIPNLGSNGRTVSMFETTDSYQIVDGQAVFVPVTMQTTLIPLPSVAALAAAGLFVLGARRRS